MAFMESNLSVFFLGAPEAVSAAFPEGIDRIGHNRIHRVTILDEQRDISKPKSVMVKRNMIAGFQNVLQVHPPSFYYDKEKENGVFRWVY
jgi:hypothetical protein